VQPPLLVEEDDVGEGAADVDRDPEAAHAPRSIASARGVLTLEIVTITASLPIRLGRPGAVMILRTSAGQDSTPAPGREPTAARSLASLGRSF
jgi:hypothetical protein